jgi:hypothetical protein
MDDEDRERYEYETWKEKRARNGQLFGLLLTLYSIVMGIVAVYLQQYAFAVVFFILVGVGIIGLDHWTRKLDELGVDN